MYPGMVHVFQAIPFLPEAGMALERMLEFMQRKESEVDGHGEVEEEVVVGLEEEEVIVSLEEEVIANLEAEEETKVSENVITDKMRAGGCQTRDDDPR